MRILAALLMLWAVAAPAQDFSGLARIDPGASQITDGYRGSVEIELSLSQGIPWRLFTLTDPDRLVLDFREVDWTGAVADDIDRAEGVSTLRFGTYRPGWSRMVSELARPMAVAQAGMLINPETGVAGLRLRLVPVDRLAFDAAAGAPNDPRWDLPPPTIEAARRSDDSALRVVIDPGHGGIDPGAEAGGVTEAVLILTLARELRDALLRAGGFDVVLTRRSDEFVSLERRVAIAHEVGADVFISLHADTLTEGVAHGTTVYTLSDSASDAASAALAERHDRNELLSGVDLSGADDVVAGVLLDLARAETQPRTEALAKYLVAGIENATGQVNKRPLRQASFSVLKAADIPSVLIEAGFLSTEQDLTNLLDPLWRAGFVAGVRDGLQGWRIEDAARRDLRNK